MTANTLRDRVEQLRAYRELATLQHGPIANLRIVKNIAMLEKEVGPLDDIQKSVSKIEGLAEYDAARHAICEEYCARGEDGSPLIVGGSFAFPSKEVFEIVASRVGDLGEKYQSALREKEAFEIEYELLLDSVVDVPLQEVSLASCKGEFCADILMPIADLLTE